MKSFPLGPSLCAVFGLLLGLLLPTEGHPQTPDTVRAIENPPAWDTSPMAPGKADGANDLRNNNPQTYGVTAPPNVSIRPWCEFEPTQRVILRPTRDIGAFHTELIKALSGHVPMVSVLHSTGHKVLMKNALHKASVPLANIEFLDVDATDSVWTRDYGPIPIVSSEGDIAFVDFRYYHDRTHDDAVPTKLAAHWGTNVYRPTLGIEGGNLMTDPYGTCFATEKLFTQNAGWSTAQVEQWTREYLGCQQLIILKRPEELGTGHIDMFCKLMDDRTVVLGAYDPEIRPTNAAILDENEAILNSIVTQGGETLTVHRMPLPWLDDDVWYTYTNSLIVNDLLLVPSFSGLEEFEAEAIAVYQEARSDLQVKTLNCDALIPSGGAIHCVTMTIPYGNIKASEPPPVLLCDKPSLDSCEENDWGCESIPAEGQCAGNVLHYCGENGYPRELSCTDGCGFDDVAPPRIYRCLATDEGSPCMDECEVGSYGCSLGDGFMWTCANTDADPCLERLFIPCFGEQRCAADTGTCSISPANQCEEVGACQAAGERRCTPSADGFDLCLPQNDGCLSWTTVSCQKSAHCEFGVCVAGEIAQPEGKVTLDSPTDESGGCRFSSSASPMSMGLLLLGVLLMLAAARRRTQVTKAH